MSDLDLFAAAGDSLDLSHFGLTAGGAAYVVAAPFAKAMGYRDAANATRLLDETERGTQIVSTPGGDQRMSVIYEDGIWELIFRSTLPSARSVKARVKAILRELRETGVVDTRPQFEIPKTYAEALELAAKHAREIEVRDTRIGELEPPAASWEQLSEASGDFSVREAAQILNRDSAIVTGQRRLFTFLKAEGWLAPGGLPYQRHVNAGRLVLRAGSFEKHSGETVVTRQVRVTVKGLHDLHKRLGGSGPLLLAA
jgi:anti-repressor protein